MTAHFSRREFLLSTAAATGALALQGCATVGSRTPSATARAVYDAIFEEQLLLSPETATSLGLDRGERAFLSSRLSDNSYSTRLGGFSAILNHAPRLRRVDRAALPAQERAWLDTVLWLADRVAEAQSFSYASFDG